MASLKDTLTRLFSNDIVMSKSGDGSTQALDVNRMQAISTDYTQGRYQRMYQAGYGGYSRSSMANGGIGGGGYGRGGDKSMQRLQLFRDYEAMEADPIIASALDVYADEIATEDEFGEILSVESENQEIKGIIQNLMREILDIDMNLRWWARSMLKYGDAFLKMHVVENHGVASVTPLDPYSMNRAEAGIGGETVFYHDDIEEEWQQWEVAHFRLLADWGLFPYGRSILENGRQLWKQLSLTEEAMLIHRIMRAPEKRVFKVDVGNINPDSIDSYMHQIIQDVQQTPLVDPQSGEYNLEFNLMNMLEDFYFPVRGSQTGTEVETLKGLNFQAIEDVEYLRKKLMSALRIPNAFLGYEKEIQGKCIAPWTKIPLASGKTAEAEEIVEHYQENENPEPLYAYSYDGETGKIVAGEIQGAEWTRENAEVVDVELDNGKTLTTTPDHKFMTREGEWVEAQNLSQGDSLMPLYRGEIDKEGMSGYETVYHPGEDKFQLFHRAVAEQHELYEEHGGSVVHHADFDKRNNRPNNLDCSMGFHEHREFYRRHAEKTINSEEAIRRRTNDPDWLKAASRAGKKGGRKNAEWLSDYASGREPANKNGVVVECDNCGEKTYKSRSRLNREQDNYYCSCSRANQINGSRDKAKLTHDQILAEASDATSFADLIERLGTTRKTLYSRIERFFGDREEFVEKHMPKISANALAQVNHSVESVTFREERIDTVDIQVKQYKNFATEAGVIVHNSTLAQESLKFAEAVRNMQKMMARELEKIGAVHLVSKGYSVEDVTNFKIRLTDPSIIAEQERIDFLQKKIRVAGDAMKNSLFSSDYVYKKLFNMSEDEIRKERKRMVDDWKREFRKDQIEREGNDPVKTGRGFGTPSQINGKQGELEPVAITGEDPDESPISRDFGLKDLSNQLRTTPGDVRPQYSQGGSPRAVNSSKQGKGPSIIQESFGLGENVDLEDEGTYMSIEGVEQSADESVADDILEDLGKINEDS
jgi:hypothetical protein